MRKTYWGDRLFVANADGTELVCLGKAKNFYWGADGKTYGTIILVKSLQNPPTGKAEVTVRNAKFRISKTVSLDFIGEITSFCHSRQGFFAFVGKGRPANKDSEQAEIKEENAVYLTNLSDYWSPNLFFVDRTPVKCLSGNGLRLEGWSRDGLNLLIYKDGQTWVVNLSFHPAPPWPFEAPQWHIKVICLDADALTPVDWSPDGQWLAYSSHNQIKVMRSDFSHPVLLSKGEFPVFSPDGQKIAFKFSNRLYLMNADSSNYVMLAEKVEEFRWSPDGTKILFTTTARDSSPKPS